MQKFFGYVGIEPMGEVSETAAVLGEALGGLAFSRDARDSYDEFPAYTAEAFGLRYALLGVPAPDEDVRDHRTTHFTLQIEPMRTEAGQSVEISEKIVATLKKHGRVNCWILN